MSLVDFTASFLARSVGRRHTSSFCDELHARGFDHGVEADLRFCIRHVECNQDLPVLRRPEVALEVIFRTPLLHPGDRTWVIHLAVEAAADAPRLDTGRLDQ